MQDYGIIKINKVALMAALLVVSVILEYFKSKDC